MTETITIEEGCVAIIISPVEDSIGFTMHRDTTESDDADYGTLIALGMIGTALYAPDLIEFMAAKGEYHTPTPTDSGSPAISLATVDGVNTKDDRTV